jgi:MFS transporter, OFA family, oxalate/formate antiporter
VYGACVGTALKWFPDRRGLAAGFTAGAYGFGTALTLIPINRMIAASGYQHAFIVWGIIQGIVVIATAHPVRGEPRRATSGVFAARHRSPSTCAFHAGIGLDNAELP